ncbi:hypothetical protein SAMN04515674_108183 [Pseudarcicella hirudinis]|uniref:Uncharacterized protein n=1 Tax=Pseudarcicella hirudinis TaxID=1079859 RepID=A0A1I5V3R1_9BACT|nr:hypothetical protein SAMN04515674_108183 [Pseudarcicella hirudinis]
MEQYYCGVCGLYIDDLPWGKEGNCPTMKYVLIVEWNLEMEIIPLNL